MKLFSGETSRERGRSPSPERVPRQGGHGQGGALVPENLRPSGTDRRLKSDGLKKETLKPSELGGGKVVTRRGEHTSLAGRASLPVYSSK